MSDKYLNSEIFLIKELNKGNHESFKRLFELYSSHLYNFSYNYLKSKEAAEDVVQETFVKIWNRRAVITTNGSFKSLIMTIALNSIRKHFNDISKENEFRDDLLILLTKESEKYSDQNNFEELVSKLESLISKMPPKRQQVFYKKKIEGATAKEIANELNITIKTVEYHVAEAMRYLKKEFHYLDASGIALLFLLSKVHRYGEA